MKKGIAGLLAGLALVAGAVAPGGMAFAEEDEGATTGSGTQSALQITPSGSRITLAPGDTLEGKGTNCPKGDDGCSITVRNIGSKPTRFRIYASPYAVSGEANELSFAEEASTDYTQLYKWISIKNADGEYAKEAVFAIPAEGEQKVEYKVEVPDSIPGGAQYAVIWAQIINDESTGGIETVGQIGAVITGRSTEDIVETVEITDYDFTKFTFGGALNAKATIKNTGNVDYPVRYYYTAKTLFGKELYSNGNDEFIAAYPGTTYHINVDWEDTPFLGIFQVEWKITAAGTEKSETAVVIIMPVIVMIVVVLLLTVIVIWIIIISRKRKERKARKLV